MLLDILRCLRLWAVKIFCHGADLSPDELTQFADMWTTQR